MDTATTFIGKPIRRVEDRRFLTGKGRYVDDVKVPDCTYAAFVRSPNISCGIRSTRSA